MSLRERPRLRALGALGTRTPATVRRAQGQRAEKARDAEEQKRKRGGYGILEKKANGSAVQKRTLPKVPGNKHGSCLRVEGALEPARRRCEEAEQAAAKGASSPGQEPPPEPPKCVGERKEAGLLRLLLLWQHDPVLALVIQGKS